MAESQVEQLQKQVEALAKRVDKVQGIGMGRAVSAAWADEIADEAEVRKLHHKYGYYLDKCLYKQVWDNATSVEPQLIPSGC